MYHFKETEGGRTVMCKAIEIYGDKRALEKSMEIALGMIEDGELTLEKIAKYTHLPIEKVKELADKQSA